MDANFKRTRNIRHALLFAKDESKCTLQQMCRAITNLGSPVKSSTLSKVMLGYSEKAPNLAFAPNFCFSQLDALAPVELHRRIFLVDHNFDDPMTQACAAKSLEEYLDGTKCSGSKTEEALRCYARAKVHHANFLLRSKSARTSTPAKNGRFDHHCVEAIKFYREAQVLFKSELLKKTKGIDPLAYVSHYTYTSMEQQFVMLYHRFDLGLVTKEDLRICAKELMDEGLFRIFKIYASNVSDWSASYNMALIAAECGAKERIEAFKMLLLLNPLLCDFNTIQRPMVESIMDDTTMKPLSIEFEMLFPETISRLRDAVASLERTPTPSSIGVKMQKLKPIAQKLFNLNLEIYGEAV